MKNKIILGAAALAGLLFIGLIYYFYNIKTRNAVEQLIRDKKLINILVAGSNKFHDNKHTFFALVSINPVNGRIGITFIPPAFKVRLDDSGSKYGRIDSIAHYNFNRLRYSLKQDLKLNIPFYIEVYGPDVKRLVDLIEGVDLYVLDQIKDPEHFKSGLNYLDGGKTLRYINSVEGNSVYLKYDRIQDILFTLYHKKDKLKRFRTLEFITEALKSIKTNMLPQEILSIADVVFRDANLIAMVLPGGNVGNYYIVDDITYKIYEKEFIRHLVIDKEPDPGIKIKVVNGTDVPGMARKFRNSLIRDGLNVVEFGTSPYPFKKKSLVICRKGNYHAGVKVSETTGITMVHYIIDSTLLYNILIIIGDDITK